MSDSTSITRQAYIDMGSRSFVARLALSLSTTFPHLTLRMTSAQRDSGLWLTIERNDFDLFVESEPYTIRQLLLRLSHSHTELEKELDVLYYARIYGQTRLSGHLRDLEGIEHLLHSFFEQTRVCTGLYENLDHYSKDFSNNSDQLVASELPFLRLNAVDCNKSFYDEDQEEGNHSTVGLCKACRAFLLVKPESDSEDEAYENESRPMNREQNFCSETLSIQAHVKVEGLDEYEQNDDRRTTNEDDSNESQDNDDNDDYNDDEWRPQRVRARRGRPPKNTATSTILRGDKKKPFGRKCTQQNLKVKRGPYKTKDVRRETESSSLCTLCSKQLANFKSVKKHMQRKHYYQRVRCLHCSFVAHFPDELITHVKQEHQGEVEDLKCPLCRSMVDVCDYIDHYKSCHASKLKTEYERGVGKHVCDTCGKVLSTRNSLLTHIRITHNRFSNILQCPHCEYSTPTKATLQGHIASKHAPKDEFGEPIREKHVCEQCGKSFLTSDSLKGHIKMKHLNIVKTKFCAECNITITGRSNINNHMAKFHSSDPKLECPECQTRFGTKYQLSRHINTHFAPKFECHVCGKKLKQAIQLKNHMRIHTGERPYKCKYCNYDCMSSSTLSLHNKFKHPDLHVRNSARVMAQLRNHDELQQKMSRNVPLSEHVNGTGNGEHTIFPFPESEPPTTEETPSMTP